MSAVTYLAPLVGVVFACAAMMLSRTTYYRRLVARLMANANRSKTPARVSARALSPPERRVVLDVIHEPRFIDLAPAEIYATLLDEKRYLCSGRTMYRIFVGES